MDNSTFVMALRLYSAYSYLFTLRFAQFVFNTFPAGVRHACLILSQAFSSCLAQIFSCKNHSLMNISFCYLRVIQAHDFAHSSTGQRYSQPADLLSFGVGEVDVLEDHLAAEPPGVGPRAVRRFQGAITRSTDAAEI